MNKKVAENKILIDSYNELEVVKKNMLKDMRQNEILHEKEVYKLNAKLKEYKYIIHEQKQTLLELDQELQQMQAASAIKEAEGRAGSFHKLNSSERERKKSMVSNEAIELATSVVLEEDGRPQTLMVDAVNELENFASDYAPTQE